MKPHILDTIPFEVDPLALMKRLHIKPDSDSAEEFQHLLDQARPLAHPRALYLLAPVTGRGEDWVEIDGMLFSSRILRVNVGGIYRVFPYLATCGQELQVWAKTIEDMVHNYWAEAIKEAALLCALQAVQAHLQDCYHPGHTASMNPGSLQDWPIQQQRILFDLFGPYAGQIGVQLTESMLMVPTKSVSGIRFETEADFESCMMCPREGCPGRRAEFDACLYAERYGLQSS
jgi:hypothetical protein